MGSSQTVWNLSCRATGIDASTAKEIAFTLSQREGSFACRYGPVFRVDPSLSENIETNCLGFVCSVLEYFDFEILSHTFPVYPSPYGYSDEDRDFPSPGHLAHALETNPPAFAWCAVNSDEAEEYARVDVTLDEAQLSLRRSQRRRPIGRQRLFRQFQRRLVQHRRTRLRRRI